MLSLHHFIDVCYGAVGDAELKKRLSEGVDASAVDVRGETPLHVAVRRRRLEATRILLDHGAHIDALNGHGKTCYAHARRRGFDEIAELLRERGADTAMNAADRFAIAVGSGELDEARRILASDPRVIRTGNPEEDRLLADVAGRSNAAVVGFLIDACADLGAIGLDTGTPLHVAAWFGQPDNVRLLIDAGAALDVFEPTHRSSPLGWAVHGARYSGGSEDRQDAYVAITKMLLEAGAQLRYPDGGAGEVRFPGGSYRARLLEDATPRVAAVLVGRG